MAQLFLICFALCVSIALTVAAPQQQTLIPTNIIQNAMSGGPGLPPLPQGLDMKELTNYNSYMQNLFAYVQNQVNGGGDSSGGDSSGGDGDKTSATATSSSSAASSA